MAGSDFERCRARLPVLRRCAKKMQCSIRSVQIPAWKVTLHLALVVYGYLGFCMLAFWWIFRPSRDFWTSPQVMPRMLVVLAITGLMLAWRWRMHMREQMTEWTADPSGLSLIKVGRRVIRIPGNEIQGLRYWTKRKRLRVRRKGRFFPYALSRVASGDASDFQICVGQLQELTQHNKSEQDNRGGG